MILWRLFLTTSSIYGLSCPTGFAQNVTTDCEDVDECETAPCEMDENCTNLPGRYIDLSTDHWFK